MAILDEMQLLVSDLEAAFSRRMDTEKERQETAARDARYRAMGVREMRATAAESARERLAEISKRSSEVAFMVDAIWRAHTGGIPGGSGAGAARTPVRGFTQPPRRRGAPEATRPAAPRAAAKLEAPRPVAKPEAPKAAVSDNAET